MKNIFLILSLLCLLSCENEENINVKVDFHPKEKIKLLTEYLKNDVVTIYLPITLEIKNRSFNTKFKLEEVASSQNSGRVYDRGIGIVHFINNNEYSLEFTHKFKIYESYSKVIYPDYQIDLKNPMIKEEMAPYIQKAVENKNKYTDIMNLKEFKNKCPNTFQYIMKEQRYLIVDFFNGNTNKWFIRDFPIKF